MLFQLVFAKNLLLTRLWTVRIDYCNFLYGKFEYNGVRMSSAYNILIQQRETKISQ